MPGIGRKVANMPKFRILMIDVNYKESSKELSIKDLYLGM